MPTRDWLKLTCVTVAIMAYVCVAGESGTATVSGDLRATVSLDLRQPLEPVNRRVLGVCMLHTPFTAEIVRELKPVLDGASVRVWLHLAYDQKYMQDIMNAVRQCGAREIFSFVPLCQMPNLVARYEGETDNNLVRDQQTPKYLANMIGFLNRKAQPGFPGGYGLNVLEVWNEPEYPQNGAWPAQDYARYALDVSRRVREADPTMQIGVCLRPDDKWPEWNREMLMAIAARDPAAVNAVVAHPYDFFWIRAEKTIGRYWATVGGSENHRAQLQRYLDLAGKIGHGRWRLALTEWNTHPPAYEPPTNVSRDLPVAINLAAAIQMYWELGVDSAHYFLVHDKQKENGVLPHFALLATTKDGGLRKNPTFQALRLIGENARGTRVATQTKGPVYAYPPMGKEKGGQPLPVALVVATGIFDFSAKELRVLLVNRHPESSMPLALELNHFQPQATAGELEVMSGSHPEAETAEITKQTVALPDHFNGTLNLTLPPHSVCVLRIPGIRPLTEEERVSELLTMIREWNLCGVFPVSKAKNHGLDTTLPCEEGKIGTAATYAGFSGSKAGWAQIRSNAGGFVDFYDPWRILGLDRKGEENLQGYAVSYLYSPAKQELTFSLGADYWAVLRVNGAVAVDMTTNPGGEPQADKVRAKAAVRQGWNRLEVRVASGGKGMGFWLGVENPGGLVMRPALNEPQDTPAAQIVVKPVQASFVSAWKEFIDKEFSEVKWAEVSGNHATARRSYVQWDLPSQVRGGKLKKVGIRLTQAFNKDGGEVVIGPVSGAWQQKQLTWSRQPECWPLLPQKVKASEGIWWFEGPEIAALVQMWADHPERNFGVYFTATSPLGFAGFVSENDAKDFPALILEMDSAK